MRHLWMVWLLLAVTACGSKEEMPEGAALPTAAPAAAQARGGAEQGTAAAAARRYLAYEHFLQLSAAEAKVPVLFDMAQAICREAVAEQCAVLQSNIRTGRGVAAELKLRAKPDGIRRIVAALSKQAKVSNQNTSAEDLATPIGDTAKKLAMLKDYRGKLEALAGQAGSNIDALIKVNRELAQVQSEIETLSGTHAHLLQRVDTEILHLSIHSDESQSFWQPVGFALQEFGQNLAQATSAMIIGIAWLLPWAVALALLWLVVRLLRRRAGKGR